MRDVGGGACTHFSGLTYKCGSLAPGNCNENRFPEGGEEEAIAKMGCPSLGEHTKLEVIIEESYEFKVRRPVSGRGILAPPRGPLHGSLPCDPARIGSITCNIGKRLSGSSLCAAAAAPHIGSFPAHGAHFWLQQGIRTRLQNKP